jgi:hypothetical protein
MGIDYNYTKSDGLTQATAARSVRSIKAHFPNSGNGLYWVKHPSANNGSPFQVYCDMQTDGGGWMLLVQNATIGGATKMNYTNYSLLNSTNPPSASSRASVSYSYSILEWADLFKNPNKPFQYMIDAHERNNHGGIWTANNPSYTFNQTVNTSTDITLQTKFGTWYYDNSSIEERMPYIAAGQTTAGMLTTSVSPSSSWWGTIIEASSSYSPAPWISAGGISGVTDSPGVIWYWMRSI